MKNMHRKMKQIIWKKMNQFGSVSSQCTLKCFMFTEKINDNQFIFNISQEKYDKILNNLNNYIHKFNTFDVIERTYRDATMIFDKMTKNTKCFRSRDFMIANNMDLMYVLTISEDIKIEAIPNAIDVFENELTETQYNINSTTIKLCNKTKYYWLEIQIALEYENDKIDNCIRKLNSTIDLINKICK